MSISSSGDSPPRRSRISLPAAIAVFIGSMALLGWSIRGYVAGEGGIRALVPTSRTSASPAPLLDEIVPAVAVDVAAAPPPRLVPGDVPGWRCPPAVADTTVVWPADPGLWNWESPQAVGWRVPVVGDGTSSPIVVQGRIFLTGVDTAETLWLACHELATGDIVWRRALVKGGFPSRHGKTSDAASTPCSDGRSVFTAWAADNRVWLAAHGLDGTPLWQTSLGGFAGVHGFASSPAWAGGLVVQNVDNGVQGFVAAIAADTGAIRWLRRRPQNGDGSYSSPLITDGRVPAVILAGLQHVASHALDDGRLLWQIDGLASVSAATPMVAGDTCVCTSGYPERRMLAVSLAARDGGPGPADASSHDATVAGREPQVVWRDDTESEIPYVPTPASGDGRLYVIHDDGLAHCRDLTTGRVLWKKRVGGNFTASPVILGGAVLCVGEGGEATLLSRADGVEQGRFRLPDGCFATPVVTGMRIIVRTSGELVCLAPAADPR